jgi:metallo-beta-lactamase family protein
MDITFHGAARNVTGSQHLINIDGYQILLDCGFFQGRRSETYERNLNLPFNAAAVDVCILSHAHIDHSGNLPNLVKSGFRGHILSTFPTRDLCNLMLRDSAKIQEQDAEYVNRRRERLGEPPIEPIYDTGDVEACMGRFIGVNYDQTYVLQPGITLTFRDAGHILGSAIIEIDIAETAGRPATRLVFSGDLGRPGRPILNDPTPIEGADVLIMESTYGNRRHADEGDVDEALEQIILDTFRRGGKVIVPAFAVGRTQELVYRLNRMVERRDLPSSLRVYVDSPLATDVTGVYRSHPEAFDREAAQALLTETDHDVFGFKLMHYTRSVAESKELNFLDKPAVIISASGMAESGRILHHLKNNIEDKRNTILIVGYQAQHTLGRRLRERERRVRIFGEDYDLRAQVAVLDGLSAHADQTELLDWVGRFRRKPDHTFLVHGEPEAAFSLADNLRARFHLPNVIVPELGQRFTL